MRSVEAVEKPLFARANYCRMARLPAEMIFSSWSRRLRFPLSRTIQSCLCASLRIPVMRQLLDVVHQAIQFPLRVYFLARA